MKADEELSDVSARSSGLTATIFILIVVVRPLFYCDGFTLLLDGGIELCEQFFNIHAMYGRCLF